MLNSQNTREEISAQETKAIYQYYHLVQGLYIKNKNQPPTKKELVEVINKLASLGIDRAYGGVGLSLDAISLLILKLATLDKKLAQDIADMNCAAQSLIQTFGTARQKEKLLPAFPSGGLICSTISPYESSQWEVSAIRQDQKSSANKNSGYHLSLKKDEVKLITSRFAETVDLVMIFVEFQPGESSSAKDIQTGAGFWALLDLKKLNKEYSEEPLNIFIPDDLIIQTNNKNSQSSLGPYYAEKTSHYLAIETAVNLVKAQKLSAKLAVYLAKNGIQTLAEQDSGRAINNKLIRSTASQWRHTSLVKKLRHFQLGLNDSARTEIINRSLLECLSGEDLGDEESTWIGFADPMWNRLAKHPNRSTQEELRVYDRLSGVFLAKILDALYWSITRDLLPDIVAGVINNLNSKQERRIRMKLMKKNLRHMEKLSSLLIDSEVLAELLGGKNISLTTAIKNIVLINASQPENDDQTKNSLIYYELYRKTKMELERCFASLPQFTQSRSLLLSFIKLCARFSLACSWGYSNSTEKEDWQVAENACIPSMERNDFLDEINSGNARIEEIEEIVKLSWLVREIFSSLDRDEGFGIHNRPPNMTNSKWYEEMSKAGIITKKDNEILQSFHKKAINIL